MVTTIAVKPTHSSQPYIPHTHWHRTSSSCPKAPHRTQILAGRGQRLSRCPDSPQLAHADNVIFFASSSGSTKYLEGIALPNTRAFQTKKRGERKNKKNKKPHRKYNIFGENTNIFSAKTKKKKSAKTKTFFGRKQKHFFGENKNIFSAKTKTFFGGGGGGSSSSGSSSEDRVLLSNEICFRDLSLKKIRRINCAWMRLPNMHGAKKEKWTPITSNDQRDPTHNTPDNRQ